LLRHVPGVDDVADLPSIIDGATAKNVATFMVDYLLPNAARFYTEILGLDQLVHARWIAGYILAHKLDRITQRDVYRVYHELRGDLPAILNAMMALTVSGWVTPHETGNGKPPTKWEVDRRVHLIFAKRAELERQRREDTRRKVREAAEDLGTTAEGALA
jgi:hypothetical protein